MPPIIDLFQYVIVGGLMLFLLYVVVRPLTATDRRKSWTLSGLFLSAFFIFGTVLIDSLNDRRPRTKESVQNVTTAPAAKGRVSTAVKQIENAVRAVGKEKYSLLGLVFLTFAVLYVVSHRHTEMADTIIRGIMAVRKLDPYADRSQIDLAILNNLANNPGSIYHQEWFLRALLAKQGKDTAQASTPVVDDGEPHIDESGLAPPRPQQTTTEEDRH